jgi:hypothetical protein
VVFDLESEARVASYRFTAKTANSVDAQVREDETEAESVERFARSSLWEDARRQLPGLIVAATGGTVDF